MARIISLQANIAFEQKKTEAGNYYPCYILSNDRFSENFEQALIVAKSAVDPESDVFETIESVLDGFSRYREWKNNRDRGTEELPTEINEHFGLLPEIDSNITMSFKALNVPSEALLYSFSEIKNITSALKAAKDTLTAEGDDERLERILGIYESFDNFLTDWEANKEATGSYFARAKETM